MKSYACDGATLLCFDRNNPMNGSDKDIYGYSDENIN